VDVLAASCGFVLDLERRFVRKRHRMFCHRACATSNFPADTPAGVAGAADSVEQARSRKPGSIPPQPPRAAIVIPSVTST
jgi:hypothetical protein